ncbi:hypothetical protein D6851_09020 [Altericroceibacterium spongiae]|uniref:Uncharacterized protein n=1 Tax=Altericroceibacterium spongiae TaxID=2320269 RepID=A0A420EK53_9SPHN|nr:hypothetical protein [Altericroceibacterium spongiae]RKF21069.1 hypothetical protein D6851_09020 [Altericroceibacterium spongiae]
MDRNDYSEKDYHEPHVPPATPPAIDPHADPEEAAKLAMDNGDSDYPGSHEASFDRTLEDDNINPGDHPDEIRPDKGDTIRPKAPDEVGPDHEGEEKPAPDTETPEIKSPPD